MFVCPAGHMAIRTLGKGKGIQQRIKPTLTILML
jgi:hypothetical protein